MKETVLAERYAKALLDLGLELKCLDRFKDEMERFEKTLAAEPQLLKILSYREFAFQKRELILNELMQKLLLSPEVKNFFKLLLQRERIRYFPQIVESFKSGVREIEKVVVAKVKVADKNSAKQLASQIQHALEVMTKSKVIFSVEEDRSLIGGLQVTIGDAIYDASIKGELERIKENWN